MTSTTNLQREAAESIQDAEFRNIWPIEVRKALVKAAQTEGDFPLYAVKQTVWALKEARRIESKCNRDIERGTATLNQSQKRELVRVGAL